MDVRNNRDDQEEGSGFGAANQIHSSLQVTSCRQKRDQAPVQTLRPACSALPTGICFITCVDPMSISDEATLPLFVKP